MKKNQALETMLNELQSIDSGLHEVIRLLSEQNILLRQAADEASYPDDIPYDFTTAPRVAPWARDDTGTYTPPNNVRIS